MKRIFTLLFVLPLYFSFSQTARNIDAKNHCYLIPDSMIISGLTPGVEHRVTVVANGTISAPMQGLFFMYAEQGGEHKYNFVPIGSSFLFKPIAGFYQLAPIYVDWSTKNDNSGSMTVSVALSDKYYVKDSLTKLLLYFNENSGDFAYDSSGNSNNASNTGAVITDGRFGKARNYNGSSNWMLVQDANSLDITNQITVEMWVYPTERKMINLISKEGAYQFYIFDDGTFSLGVYSGYPWHQITSNQIVPLNQWSHLAGTFDNTTKKFQLFLNGMKIKDTIDVNASLTASSEPLYIGRNGSANVYHMKGMIDETRISNTTRSFSPITSVANFKNIVKSPAVFKLSQNFPNPFNPTTTINYDIVQRSPVRIVIYDEIGKEITTLVDGEKEPGSYSVQWNGRDKNNIPVSTGVYYYSVLTGQEVQTRKMLLLK